MESFLENLKHQVQCSLCSETLIEPKLLQCFHTFCKSCIKSHAQLTEEVNIFKCPQCTSQTLLQELNDVEDLKISPVHSGILQVLSLVEICSVSASHSQALSHCLDCNHSLCEECVVCHSRFTKNHHIVSLSDLKKEDIEKMLKKENPCKTHDNQVVNFHCQDCDILICVLCLKDHHNHKTTSLPEFIAIEKDLLSKNLEEIDKMSTDENKKKQQEEIALLVKRHGDNAQEQVKKLTKKLVKALTDNEQHLLNQIQKCKTKADMNLRIIRHTTEAREFINNLIELGTASNMATNIIQQMDSSKKFIYDPFPGQTNGINFDELCKQMSIMHDFIIKLIKKNEEESCECLYKLLSTTGKDLDHPKQMNPQQMNLYPGMVPQQGQPRIQGTFYRPLITPMRLPHHSQQSKKKIYPSPTSGQQMMQMQGGGQPYRMMQQFVPLQIHFPASSPSMIPKQHAQQQLVKTESQWIHPSKAEKPLLQEEKKTQETIRKCCGILNKLTPQKFQTLIQQVLDLEIDTPQLLEEIIDITFEKAIREPAKSECYANMCRCLLPKNVKITQDGKDEILTFRKILLNKCQKEFEKEKDDEQSIHIKKEDLLKQGLSHEEVKLKKAEFYLGELKGRRRSLGNIRFIGELFKLKMLTESIMHDCIIKLIKSNDEGSFECVCELLSTVGKNLDHPKAKPRMDQYFEQINKLINLKTTSTRCRLVLQDVVDLRGNNWVLDGIHPKNIDRIHEQLAKQENESIKAIQQSRRQTRENQNTECDSPRLTIVPQTDENWTTLPGRTTNVDSTKTQAAKKRTNLDTECISLGPGGHGQEVVVVQDQLLVLVPPAVNKKQEAIDFQLWVVMEEEDLVHLDKDLVLVARSLVTKDLLVVVQCLETTVKGHFKLSGMLYRQSLKENKKRGIQVHHNLKTWNKTKHPFLPHPLCHLLSSNSVMTKSNIRLFV